MGMIGARGQRLEGFAQRNPLNVLQLAKIGHLRDGQVRCLYANPFCLRTGDELGRILLSTSMFELSENRCLHRCLLPIAEVSRQKRTLPGQQKLSSGSGESAQPAPVGAASDEDGVYSSFARTATSRRS
jgi:hypothetical protein